MKKNIITLFVFISISFLSIAFVQSNENIIKVADFELDTQRCSFYNNPGGYGLKDNKNPLPFYTWKDDIIEQHFRPEVYFRRYEEEARKFYFRNIHNYFREKARRSYPNCYRYVENSENFWRFPFHPVAQEECNNLFPSKYELFTIHERNPRLYSDLMYWYSNGIGIPYPIFNIVLYNNTDETAILTHVIYNVEWISQYLPGIVENPPLRPYVHELNVVRAVDGKEGITRSNIDQKIKINKSITGLSISAKDYINFSILLKSQSGIGHICKIKMRFVVFYQGSENIITDQKLNFVTILSSKPKSH